MDNKLGENNCFSIQELFEAFDLDITNIDHLEIVSLNLGHKFPEITKTIDEIIELRKELRRLKDEANQG